jgi:hypothetical protein
MALMCFIRRAFSELDLTGTGTRNSNLQSENYSYLLPLYELHQSLSDSKKIIYNKEDHPKKSVFKVGLGGSFQIKRWY